MLEILASSALLITVIATYEWRLRALNQRMLGAPDRREVEKLIDLKLEVVKAQHDDLKEDIHRLETKIDLLLQKRD